jgi:hypothetical protein
MDIGLPPPNVSQPDELKSKAVSSVLWVEFTKVSFDQTTQQSKHSCFRQTHGVHDLGQSKLRSRVAEHGQNINGAR